MIVGLLPDTPGFQPTCRLSRCQRLLSGGKVEFTLPFLFAVRLGKRETRADVGRCCRNLMSPSEPETEIVGRWLAGEQLTEWVLY